MGNAVDKGRGQGYYGGTGEDISYEEAEDFLIVTLSPATIANSLPENNRTPKSPFEATTTAAATTAAERTVHLEGSIDSGYAEVHAANKCVSGTIPEQIPTKPTENVDVDVVGLSDPDCRTAKSLGNSHGFFGFRHYNYNDTECEGNKHILDDDL